MSLYKRKNSNIYWIGFTVNGKRFQRSTRTPDKEEALRIHALIESELRDQARYGAKPDPVWEEVAAMWFAERENGPSKRQYIILFRGLKPFLSGLKLSKIDSFLIETITQALKKGRKPATVNSYLHVISGVLRYAYDREWLDKMPKIRIQQEPTRRVRWLTREEFERLAAALPMHLAEMARFAVVTGLRQTNVSMLRWDQVDMVNRVVWIEANEVKTKVPLAIPLNADACAVIRRQIGVHQEYVFTYHGRAIPRIQSATWKKALAKAGIKNFRWHDLRHTWASWHKQAGTDALDLQELGGWKSMAMLRRYAHLSVARKHEVANRIVTVSLHAVREDEENQEVIPCNNKL